ncbi:MAG: GtrA family protein [Clostridia bacterium]|nr:GtrA family protein [Clostridia bacterium]
MLEKFLQIILSPMPKTVKNVYKKYESILKYCYYGAWTTLVSYLTKVIGAFCFTLMNYSMQSTAPNMINTTISWFITVCFAFYVNKRYVFMTETTSAATLCRELYAFFGARFASYFLELGFMWITTVFLKFNYLFMAVLVQFIILIINYAFSKLVIFKKAK